MDWSGKRRAAHVTILQLRKMSLVWEMGVRRSFSAALFGAPRPWDTQHSTRDCGRAPAYGSQMATVAGKLAIEIDWAMTCRHREHGEG